MDYFDKNGKPCKACFSVEDMMKMSKKFSEKKATSSTSSTEINEKTIQNVVEERRVKQCPVDKDELGRSTWNLLHTMAAYYPEKPSTEEKKTMETTLISLSKTYPCSYCADDFRKDLKVHPPKLENREELSKWMCEMHNRVNKKLGKDIFDCTKYMNKSVFRVPGTSTSTENGSTNDTGNNELNNEYGPDTEFVTTCRRMFSSPRRSSNEVSLQTKLPSTSKATKETGIIVPVNPSSRRLSFEEDTTNGIRLGEIISASILELFFSTLPPTQQDKIRTCKHLLLQ
uniref:Sulfhydryl oxidase n=1 Tax=Panagrolaimus davidi TaxID=227884 RepID=A0A914PNR8_9BILA